MVLTLDNELIRNHYFECREVSDGDDALHKNIDLSILPVVKTEIKKEENFLYKIFEHCNVDIKNYDLINLVSNLTTYNYNFCTFNKGIITSNIVGGVDFSKPQLFGYNTKDKLLSIFKIDFEIVDFPLDFVMIYVKDINKGIIKSGIVRDSDNNLYFNKNWQDYYKITFLEEDSIQFRWKLFNYGKGF